VVKAWPFAIRAPSVLGRLREAKTVADAVLDRIAGVLAGGDRIELRGFDAAVSLEVV
jgi:hypothetical protein